MIHAVDPNIGWFQNLNKFLIAYEVAIYFNTFLPSASECPNSRDDPTSSNNPTRTHIDMNIRAQNISQPRLALYQCINKTRRDLSHYEIKNKSTSDVRGDKNTAETQNRSAVSTLNVSRGVSFSACTPRLFSTLVYIYIHVYSYSIFFLIFFSEKNVEESVVSSRESRTLQRGLSRRLSARCQSGRQAARQTDRATDSRSRSPSPDCQWASIPVPLPRSSSPVVSDVVASLS